MPLEFDAASRSVLDLAKACLPEGQKLGVGLLLDATSRADGIPMRWHPLRKYLHEPEMPHAKPPERVQVSEDLQSILEDLSTGQAPITLDKLLLALLESAAGQEHLASRGMPRAELDSLLDESPAAPTWADSTERAEAIRSLSGYGRMLTAVDLPNRNLAELEESFQFLIRTLVKRKRRNSIVIGYPGTGKTALIYELARRLREKHESVPDRLRDHDIFELSPSFLRSGASVVGEYDKRVKGLIETLQANPKIILFVDEIHSLFQSGVHDRGPFSDANEAFKGVLGRGEITVIGCTTIGEYRHHIEPDGALVRRFEVIRLQPPTGEAALKILEARLPDVERFYAPVRVPREILSRIVELTEEYLPSRYQPDKSIQLLDDACAHCTVSKPPLEEVTEAVLWQALESLIGHKLVRSERLTGSAVLDRLQAKILGQDEALQQIATAFVSGLGSWSSHTHPRGVFLFGGPTGVGKTETALLMARILGDEQRNLLRIDCNLLQESGHSSGTVTTRLLGVPPGYVGYARGEGGILSKIRDVPESIVLFDEIEKAGLGVGALLLQIMDDGKVEDADGNALDFRRSFIVFTTNAGFGVAARTKLGFDRKEQGDSRRPVSNEESMKASLRQAGFPDEFLGRISHFVMFRELDQESIKQVIRMQIERLRRMVADKDMRLDWDDVIVDHVAAQWMPQFGVRHLATILRHRVVEQLSLADAQGELEGVKRIRLAKMNWDEPTLPERLTGLAIRERDDDTLIIRLA